MNKNLQIYLVICTRNRNHLLVDLLTVIQNQELLPTKIVIVDSSDEFIELPEEIYNYYPRDAIVHFASSPGLPFQRNQGINRIKTFEVEDNDLISFLDDDIRPVAAYFATIRKIAIENQHILGFTGVNLNNPMKCSKLARFFLLNSEKYGKIIKSGKTTPPYTNKEFEITDWAPGGSMNLRAKVFENIAFRAEIRMYGEDLDFSLRLAKYGQTLVVRDAKYIHLNSTVGKDNIRIITKYSDLIQFLFAIEHPKRVSKICVFWSVFGMSCLNIKNVLLNINRSNNQEEIKGHFDFLYSLIKGNKFIQ